ncbi:hypothetical protein OQA88_2033 [Cercophora sp. LCS_1]
MGPSEKSLTHEVSHKGSHDYEESATQPEPSWTPEAERKLLNKIDMRLMPMLWLMNLLSWMDRANLGNANIAGLTADLSLSSTQFSLAIICYYFGYIAWLPCAMAIAVRTRPSLYLPAIVLLWGVVTASISAVKTYPQLLVLRVLIGILEAGLTPGVSFILSCWYPPTELGKRTSTFLTSAQVGGAFGGLIAGGVMSNLEGARGIRGWRWLFIVEGVVTVFVAMLAVFILPDFPASDRRLSEEEKKIAIGRLERARVVVDSVEGEKDMTIWEATVYVLKDWRTYALSLGSALTSATLIMAYFYPVLVKGLGYTNPITAQYMTIPIWVVAFVFTVAGGYLADRVPRHRGLFCAGGLALLGIAAMIVCGVYDFKARYALLAIMAGGVWLAYAQLLAYVSEIFKQNRLEIRSMSFGFIGSASQTGYLYGAYLFPAENAPKHLTGFGVVAGTACTGAIVFMATWWYERRKRRLTGDKF